MSIYTTPLHHTLTLEHVEIHPDNISVDSRGIHLYGSMRRGARLKKASRGALKVRSGGVPRLSRKYSDGVNLPAVGM